MAQTNGSGLGNLVVKSLNGMGLIAVIAMIWVLSAQVSGVKATQASFEKHCQEAAEARKVQVGIDAEQDKVVSMMNAALIRIEANGLNTKESVAEIRQIVLSMNKERQP